jgi:hypothetical protein
MKSSKANRIESPIPEAAETFGQRMEKLRAEREAAASPRLSLCTVYGMRPGAKRRELLLKLLRTPSDTGAPPTGIAVNNKWLANTVDPDLRYLMKKGVLVQVRLGNGRRHPQNRSSRKCQSYLVLASTV